MRHSFTWTVAIALAAVACGSDSNPTDSESGSTVAGSTAAGRPSAIGGVSQINAGGTTASGASAGSITAAGALNSSVQPGGAASSGVGGTTVLANAGAPSTGGIATTSVGGSAAGGASTTDVSATGGVAIIGGASGGSGASGAGGVAATGGSITAAAGACAVTYYRDADGDTWGASESSCTAAAGWVTRTGDCHDGNANVFPEQTTTFALSYLATDGTQSFDYNCDGSETIAGGTQVSSGACETSGLGNGCSGDGYLPVEPARTGTDLNQICGSMRYIVCARSQQVCIGAVSTDGTYQAARCK